MTDWCRGVNLDHVAAVHVDPDLQLPDRQPHYLIDATGKQIAETVLDDAEYAYFFPRAILPAWAGTEYVELRHEDGVVEQHWGHIIGWALPQEITEPAFPLTVEGVMAPHSHRYGMFLWRVPGGPLCELCGGQRRFDTIEAAIEEFRAQLDADARLKALNK